MVKNALPGKLDRGLMARPKRSHDDCPYETSIQALKCIGGRWKVLIVRRLLADGVIGFNALQRALGDVSAKMLSQQLRELQDDGVVVREELVSEPPKTVHYRLTPLGLKLEPVVEALSGWGRDWLEQRRQNEQKPDANCS